MSKSIYISVGIAIITLSTGVRGITCICTSGICNLRCIAMFTGSVRNCPTVFYLRSTEITDNTVNGNCTTDGRLLIHFVVSYRTVCIVESVNINLIAIFIYNINITISRVGHLNNFTSNVILIGSIVILCVKCTESKCLFNSKNRICFRRNYISATIADIIFCITGMFAGSRSGYDAYNTFTIRASYCNSTCNSTSNIDCFSCSISMLAIVGRCGRSARIYYFNFSDSYLTIGFSSRSSICTRCS